MKKTSKAILIAVVVAMIVSVSMALVACNSGIEYTKYDANISAIISMGPAGDIDMGEGLVKNAYVYEKDGQQYLTVVFDKSEITIMNIPCTTFIDDSNGAKIGLYDSEGNLTTDGVEFSYSTGDDYIIVKNEPVFYVKSATFPISGEIKDKYKIAVYVNSTARAMQFSEDTNYKAVLKINLESAETVKKMEGIGSYTKSELLTEVLATEYTKYGAELDAKITMGPMGTADFGGPLLAGVYSYEATGKKYLTIVFAKNQISIMGAKVEAFIDGGENAVTGYYDGDELVTSGLLLTYSYGTDYAKNSDGDNVYYLKSMTFEVDSVSAEYALSIYVNSTSRGAQFGEKYSATLKIDLSNTQNVDSISSLLGVREQGEVK